MAEKFYSKWTHSGLSGEGRNLGDITIWKNKPEISVHYDWSKERVRWWYTAQGQNITSNEDLDDDSNFTLNYNLTTNGNLYAANFGASGDQSVSGTKNINLLYPFEATPGTLSSKTTTRPTAARTDAGFSYYHKGQESPWDAFWGGIGERASFAISISGNVYDNTFAANISDWSVDRTKNTFYVNMATTSLPKLINKSKTTEDMVTSDENTINSNKQYIFSTAANSDWACENYIPNPSTSNFDKYDTETSISGIILYNDEIYIRPTQLGSITNFKREKNTISWNAITGANQYKVYCDGILLNTQTSTSYTIPDELYYDQKHTYSVEICDYSFAEYQTQEISGKWNSNRTGAYYPRRVTTFTVRKGVNAATHANWTDVGYISAPTATPTKLAPNKYEFTLSGEYNADTVDFYYSEGINGTKEIITNRKVIFDKLKVNVKRDLYFWTKITTGGKSWFSEYDYKPITPTKITAPNIISVTKTGINSYSVVFSDSPEKTSYKVYLNGIIYNGNASSPINVSGWKAATSNKIKVEAVYADDTSYNNSTEKSYGAEYTPILTTPTLKKKDIKENNIEQGFGDAGSKEIINNVVTQVELSWNAIEYASGYVLYDKYKIWNNDTQSWEEGTRIYPTQEADIDTEYMQTTVYKIYMDNVMGYHDYSTKAIATVDESYNSNISNTLHIEQNFPLPAPRITHTTNSTEFTILQPEVDNLNGITQEAINNIDFYSVQLVPSGNSTHTLFRSFTPSSYPTTYSFYDMIKDLRESEYFTGSAFSRSYNAFYFHPSADSDTKFSVNVVKLATPVNLLFDADTSIITWTGDPNAYKFEIKLKAIDGDWVTKITDGIPGQTNYSYDLGELAPSLYTLYITALRDDANRIQPIYLDSEMSQIISFGTINTPKDFSRHVNTFSWTSVGADRYIFYEWVRNEDNVGQYDIVYENGKPVYVLNETFTGQYDAVSLTTLDGGGVSLKLGMVEGDEYRPTEGKHYYSVQGQSTINDVEYASKLSDIIEVDIEYLKKLEPYFIEEVGYTSSVIEWQALNDFVVYDTRVNNINEKDEDNDTTYTLDKDEAGSYFFKVRSRSTRDEFLYQSSEFSDEILYNVIKLNRPQISLTKDEATKKYTFTWDVIDNATYYYIHINKDGQEDFEFTVEENTFEYFALEGMYSIYVISKNDHILRNPKYIDSEISNMKKFGVLKAPEEVTLTENIVSWKENSLVDYYEIYNYGKKFAETDRNMFELDVSKPYSYSISIVACSLEEDIIPSKKSSSVEYIVTQLDTPQGVRILDDDVLSWGLVLNADSYRIYIDNELAAITSGIKFNLKDFLAVRAGVLKIHVVAFSNKINFLDSEPSNYVLKRIEKEKKFNIVINDINYDNIQLPFTMNFTLDETLDTAGITLAYIDIKEPFERLTPADIVIYESAGASRRFPMVIEKDEVVEVKIGSEIKYKHYLQMIERTVLLQNEIIPDFSISSSVRDFILRDNSKVSPYTGTNLPVSHKDTIGFGTYDYFNAGATLFPFLHLIVNVLDALNITNKEDLGVLNELANPYIPLGVVWFKGITKDGEINNLVAKNFNVGESFVLPITNTRLTAVSFSVKSLINNLLEILDIGSLEDLASDAIAVVAAKIALALAKTAAKVVGWVIAVILFLLDYIIYIVRILTGKRGYTWNGLLEKLMTTDLSVIGDTFFTDNDWAFPGRIYKIRDHATGKEEVIRSYETGFTNKVDTYAFQKSGTYDLIMEIPGLNTKELLLNNLIDFDSSILNSFGDDKSNLPYIEFMKDANGNPTTFRVEWRDIEVRKKVTSAEYLKISTVLDKVTSLTNNKYTIDPEVISLTSTLNCPDMTFSNGNYLYDVLEEIGREFYGIPRLLEDNIITFDILGNNTFADKQMTFWTPSDVLGNSVQDLDQVSSGFISRVSNMAPDEDYTIYPAPGLWISPRSDDKNTASTYVESYAIPVDKPIYRIHKVFLKNAVNEMKDLVLDITDYVYQDMVYHALNDNPDGKGLALCWKQGDTFIRGLGQLPEASKFYSIMGWNPDVYVIDKIVNNYIEKNLKANAGESYSVCAPGDMLFQIEYQGYTDTTLYIENPDKKNNKYAMYSVFNQEDNTISDTRFGSGALTVLKRHNTNMVQKEYQSYSLLRLPLLGNSTTIEGAPYYIDNLTYEFNNGYTKATCNFSKNYNKINPRTAVNTEYRQYELRSDNVVDRVLNFNEYCILGNNETFENSISAESSWRKTVQYSLSGRNLIKPECFYINCYNSENLDKIPYLTSEIGGYDKDNKPVYNIVNKNIEGIALPLAYNRIGLSVSFSASMYDNFSAGFSSKRENTKKDNLERLQGFVRYVGDNSLDQLPYMRISLGSMSNYIKNYSTVENGVTVSVSDTFPGVPWLDQPTVSLNDVYFSKFLKPYKDQREAFKFNYQMHFISNRDDLFIHKGFTKYLFRSPNTVSHSTLPVLVGYTNDITNKDYMDGPSTTVDGSLLVSENSILFDSFQATNNYKGLAVIWPDTKEILLEIRKPVTKGETVSVDPIYFNFSSKIKR